MGAYKNDHSFFIAAICQFQIYEINFKPFFAFQLHYDYPNVKNNAKTAFKTKSEFIKYNRIMKGKLLITNNYSNFNVKFLFLF